MKNALIIFPYPNHNALVFNMVKNLRANNLVVDALNSANLQFIGETNTKVKFKYKLLSWLLRLPIPKIKGVISRIVGIDKILFRITEKYDLIDFHMFSPAYDSIIKELIKKGKKVKISIWGSDFYRASHIRREQQRPIYRLCNRIQISTREMKNDFVSYFNDFEDKIRIVNFGIHQFDIIDKIQKLPFRSKFKPDEYKDRLTVICGYNGSNGQQHLTIIGAIKKLDGSVKSKMYLILPMTYGCEKAYYNNIKKELLQLNVPYLIIRNFLDDETNAKLRIAADLVINIQKTDAFSGSLQEHLYAGCLLLVGDWLPYSILHEKGVFYKTCSMDNLDKKIADCVENYDVYKRDTTGNKEKMHQISSWSNVGKRMSDIYKELV